MHMAGFLPLYNNTIDCTPYVFNPERHMLAI